MNDPRTAAGHRIPPDDPGRALSIARPETDETLSHIGLVGDTYTILLGGEQTAGRFTLIDMHVPPGGGPPPHRHDFEEMFHVLEGQVQLTFRGERSTLGPSESVNIPANAPHAFTNAGERPARLLCLCSPPGQEEFFRRVGVAVEARTTPPPALTEDEQADMIKKTQELAPLYRTELLGPPED